MRVLGSGDAEASEAMNDILAQVATNTEGMKNVGNAILYEAVLCIMEIQAESGLRVLAVNILGKFLLNTDRNIRYVALNTLLKTVQSPDNSDAVQRHRGTIIDCLREPDISIRRRALVLVFALITSSNIRALVKELLDFLEVAETEFKQFITTEILLAAEKHAPDRRWHVDTALSLLQRAGTHIREEMIPSITQLFAQASDMHPYVVQSLLKALMEDITSQPLCQVGLWCLGEYGNMAFEPTDVELSGLNAGDVLDIIQTLFDSPTSTQVTREYALTTVMKLSVRLPLQLDRIRTMVGSFANNVDIELQQRSAEYTCIFNQFNSIRGGLLEAMPIAETRNSAAIQNRDLLDGDSAGQRPESRPVETAPVRSDNLLDLLGDDVGSTHPASVTPVMISSDSGGGGMLDLLGGLDFSGSSVPPPTVHPSHDTMSLMDLLGSNTSPRSNEGVALYNTAPQDDLLMGLMGGSSGPAATSHNSSLLDLLGGGPTISPLPSTVGTSIVAFQEHGLTVRFILSNVPGNPSWFQVLCHWPYWERTKRKGGKRGFFSRRSEETER